MITMANKTPANPLGAGRYSKLTPQLIEDASKIMAAGNYVKTAVGFLNISEDCWYNWIREAKTAIVKQQRGEQLTSDEQLRIDFQTAIQKAQEAGIIRNMQIIQNAATTNWQAAAWLLERRHPDMFSLAQRITVNAQPQQLSPDEVRQQIEDRKKMGEVRLLREDTGQ